MGRYFNGDINGKFWFGIQSSNDADFFGVSGSEPNYLNYYFDKDNLPDVKKGIKICKKELGKYKKKIDDFFKKNTSYRNDIIAKEFKIPEEKVRVLLEWYARLELGERIRKCIEDTGYCEFEAEL